MKLKTHPILKELQINEDGTQMYWEGKPLKIHEYTNNLNNYPKKIVHIKSGTHTVSKLVCEAWNGMREDLDHIVKRRDLNPNNNHYKNLYWGARGGYRTKKHKRNKQSKIKESEIAEIVEQLNAGVSPSKLARMYNTSTQSIYRIKWNASNPKMILKNALRKAKDNYYKRLAYARFFGFSDVNEAVSQLGMNTFIRKCEAVVL